MTEADLSEVCAIEQETFSQPWNQEDFRSSLYNPNNGYLVAEVEGNVIGYCGYWGIAGEADICNVAVSKEFRRQQIGLQMLKDLIKIATDKGIASFTLEVRSSNEAAIRLYQSLGFIQEGLRKDFYSKPNEDAVIMWLRPIQ